MKIELRKIKLLKSLSEETPAYTADVYVDGKLFCHVSNHGHGGCDMEAPPKGVTGNELYGRLELLNKQIGEEFPEVPFGEGMEGGFKQTLEYICHCQVWDDDLMKTVKRDLAGKVMFTKTDGRLYSIKAKTDADKEKVYASLNTRSDVKAILNKRSLDDALAIYKAQ